MYVVGTHWKCLDAHTQLLSVDCKIVYMGTSFEWGYVSNYALHAVYFFMLLLSSADTFQNKL